MLQDTYQLLLKDLEERSVFSFSRKPTLFIVCGASGVGKTTTANRLAQKVSGVVLTSEKIIKKLFVETSNEGKDKDFTKKELDVGYRALYLTAETLLKAGKNVVLDGVFRSVQQRESAIRLATCLGVEHFLIQVVCTEELVKKRVSKRFQSGKQPGGFKNHLYLKKVFESIIRKDNIIDTSRNVENQIKNFVRKNL